MAKSDDRKADDEAESKPMAHHEIHEGMRDAHLGLHGQHLALAEMAGEHEGARAYHAIAGHHLKLAEHHHSLAEALKGSGAASGANQRAEAEMGKPLPAKAAGGDPLAAGAATQLHRKGHIDRATHDRIHAAVGRGAPIGAKKKPFGSLAGAGHYMGDIDTDNSAGTNA